MKIGFYINGSKDRAEDTGRRLRESARRPGLEVVGLSSLDAADSAIIVLGGDGTILRCVREYPDIPVIGFNLGGLGYLSSVEERDFDSALSLLADGRFHVASRTMLSLESSSSARRPASSVSLNDIVITREMTGHAALVEVSIDGHRPTRYLADGLIIATPTGSTAYSLSAGGPVVMPDSRSFVITPMNPHALGIRPQVVSDSAGIVITSLERPARPAVSDIGSSASGVLGVYSDGEPSLMLQPGESVEISKARASARFIELEGCDPYAVLAHKLGWSGTSL